MTALQQTDLHELQEMIAPSGLEAQYDFERNRYEIYRVEHTVVPVFVCRGTLTECLDSILLYSKGIQHGLDMWRSTLHRSEDELAEVTYAVRFWEPKSNEGEG